MITLALFEQFFDSARYQDASIYFIMGSVASLIFFIRLAMMMFFGMDGVGDVDVEFDVDGDLGHVDSDASFQLFSLFSFTSFFMGAGWMGFACRYEFGLGELATAVIAMIFGFAMMGFAAFLMLQAKKLDSSGDYDVNKTIGLTGKVYLKIPPAGQGTGQVEVNVDGRQKIMTARTESSVGIDSFTAVTVTAVDDDETLVVHSKQESNQS